MMDQDQAPQSSPSDPQADTPLQAREQNGDRRYAPPDAPLSSQPLAEDDKRYGSLWAGFGLFWGITICAILVWFFVTVNSSTWSAAGIIGAILELSPLLLGIWLGIRGRTRTVLGILLGYASVMALVLLLYSVCAVLVSSRSII
jgi:hypothetical protein